MDTIATYILPLFEYFDVGKSTALLFSKIFIIVFTILVFNFLLAKLCRLALRKARKTDFPWDDVVLLAGIRPIRLLVWVYGFAYILSMLHTLSPNPLFAYFINLKLIAVLVISGWFLIRLVQGIEYTLIYDYHKANNLDRTTIEALAKLLRISIIITVGLTLLQSLGVSIAGVLAFGGISGIAVGFAAKDLLANFFGAFTIYFDRPFAVGDWIRSPDQDIEGTVENIGWRMTCIRRFDKRPLYVPNSVFTHITVENPSRMSHRRISETIGVRYKDIHAVENIASDIRQMLQTHDAIDAQQTLIVRFDKFNDSSLDIFVYAFTNTIAWVEYHQVKEAILLDIASIIEKHGAEIAFPTTTLHIAQEQDTQNIQDA